MSTTLYIPKLAVSMTEGKIAEWLCEDGATVNAGDPLYRLETDKTDAEIEAPVGGVLHIEAEPGETLEVGTPIAEID